MTANPSYQSFLRVTAALSVGVATLATGSVDAAVALTPDNTGHYLCRTSSNANLVAAWDHGIGEMRTLPNWGSNIHTSDCGDVKFYDGTWSDDFLGSTGCLSWSFSSPGRCDVMRSRLNQRTLGSVSIRWKSTGCHELGHTVDLPDNSRTSSCMFGTGAAFPLNFDGDDDNAAVVTYFFASL